MDFQITPTFKRRDLVLQCTGTAPTNGVFEVDIGGRFEMVRGPAALPGRCDI